MNRLEPFASDDPASSGRPVAAVSDEGPADRQRDIGDVRFELKEPASGPRLARHRSPVPSPSPGVLPSRRSFLPGGLAYTVWPRSTPVEAWVNPLANAQFTRITDFPGTETHASISPDGRFVAFLSDRDGPMHVWLTQVGSGRFTDLTRAMPSIAYDYAVRRVGFSGDGTEVWTGSRRSLSSAASYGRS